MRLAIVGSRNLQISNSDIDKYISPEITEIVSGGADGVDTCGKKYAEENNIKYTEFLPEYKKYGRCAPLKRNIIISEYCDSAMIFWDGISNGTKHIIDSLKKQNKPFIVIIKPLQH